MSTAPSDRTPQVILQQAPPTALGRYGRYLLAALVIAVLTILGQAAAYRSYFSPSGGPQEKYHSLSETARKKIAIIKIEGTILDPEGFVKQQIDRVRKDENVVAVVLRIDSPGGTVTASDYLYHQLRKLAKDRELPIVASMGGMCASGGYYLAMAVGDRADAVFAEPATWTGSIGVVIPHYNVAELLAKWNVEDDSVVSDKFKLMGSPTRRLSPEEKIEERKLLQELVDRSFSRFKEVVRNGRPKLKADEAALDKAANGQIYTAEQALELGLIDKIGFIDEAIARAANLAGSEPAEVRCVKYDSPPGLLSMIGGASTDLRPTGRVDVAALLELAAPRAYYVCTWLPALLSNSK